MFLSPPKRCTVELLFSPHGLLIMRGRSTGEHNQKMKLKDESDVFSLQHTKVMAELQ